MQFDYTYLNYSSAIVDTANALETETSDKNVYN